MSLGNLDPDYRHKLKNFCRKVCSLPIGDPDESTAPDDGYIRIYRGRTRSRRSHIPPNVDWRRGMDAAVLEDEVARRLADVATETGWVWVEAIYQGETNPWESFKVRCNAHEGGELMDIMAEQGGANGLLMAHAQVVQTLSKSNVQAMQLCADLVEGQLEEAYALGQLNERVEGIVEQAKAQAMSGMVEAVGPQVVKTLGDIIAPAIRATFAGQGGGGGGEGGENDMGEQPDDHGLERLQWDLNVIEACVRDAVMSVQAMGGQIPPAIQQRIAQLYQQLTAVMQMFAGGEPTPEGSPA